MPESYGATSPIMDPLAKALLGAGQATYRGMTAPHDALNSTVPITSDQMIAPAMDIAGMATLGSGMVPGEADALRAGIKLPKEYYEAVPIDRRMQRTGISHPGVRWEVYDPKTGKVMRSDIQTSSGANLSKDRLDNKYGAYRYQTRPTLATNPTDEETQFLQSKGLNLGGQTAPDDIRSSIVDALAKQN